MDLDPSRLRFEQCFREHYADLLAFALRRVSERHGAEDAVAESFAIAWRRRQSIPDPALPWLYGVTLKVIANQRRSGKRRRNLGRRLAAAAEREPGAADPGDAIGRREAFATAFGRLTGSQQEVLRLVAWDGLDPAAAAAVLGCSEGAFRVRLHRARGRLAKHLRAAGHSPERTRAPSSEPAEEQA